MAILKRTLVWDTIHHFGEGWNPNQNDEYSIPLAGQSIVHDIIDHPIELFNDGWKMEDELRALGALLHRREIYPFGGSYRMSFDIPSLIVDGISSNLPIHINPISRRCEVSKLIKKQLNDCKKSLAQDWKFELTDEYYKDSVKELTGDIQSIFRYGADYIMQGYLKAQNGILAKVCPHGMKIIEDGIIAAFKHDGECNGDYRTVIVDTEKISVRVKYSYDY